MKLHRDSAGQRFAFLTPDCFASFNFPAELLMPGVTGDTSEGGAADVLDAAEASDVQVWPPPLSCMAHTYRVVVTKLVVMRVCKRDACV